MAFTRKTSTKRERVKTIDNNIQPTGVTMLDLGLGGGAQWGKIINIVGDRSAGKTILTCEILAKAKGIWGNKLKFVYDDAENGFSIPTERMYGIHIRNQEDYRSNTVEELEVNLAREVESLQADEKLIYILDTVEGLQSEAELKHIEMTRKAIESGKEAPGTYGAEKAKKFNQLLRSKYITDKRVLTVFVSQTRDKMNVTFGSAKTRHCERALEYWSSVIVYLRVAKEITKTIDKKEYTIGAVVEAMIKKNKIIGSKFKPLLILRDGFGVDDVDTNLCFLFDLIDGRFSLKEQINVEFDNETFKKRSDLIKYIEEEDLENDLVSMCKEKWSGILEKLAVKDRKKRY